MFLLIEILIVTLCLVCFNNNFIYAVKHSKQSIRDSGALRTKSSNITAINVEFFTLVNETSDVLQATSTKKTISVKSKSKTLRGRLRPTSLIRSSVGKMVAKKTFFTTKKLKSWTFLLRCLIISLVDPTIGGNVKFHRDRSSDRKKQGKRKK